jgi:hypothetical protein
MICAGIVVGAFGAGGCAMSAQRQPPVAPVEAPAPPALEAQPPEDGGAPRVGSPLQSVTTAPDDFGAPPTADELDGVWTGWYVCGQKKIGLQLTIRPSRLQEIGKTSPPQFALEVVGRFETFPLAESPDVAAANGWVEGSFRLGFNEVRTVPSKKFPQQQTIQLSGHFSSDRTTWSGDSSGEGCGPFWLQKGRAERKR